MRAMSAARTPGGYELIQRIGLAARDGAGALAAHTEKAQILMSLMDFMRLHATGLIFKY